MPVNGMLAAVNWCILTILVFAVQPCSLTLKEVVSLWQQRRWASWCTSLCKGNGGRGTGTRLVSASSLALISSSLSVCVPKQTFLNSLSLILPVSHAWSAIHTHQLPPTVKYVFSSFIPTEPHVCSCYRDCSSLLWASWPSPVSHLLYCDRLPHWSGHHQATTHEQILQVSPKYTAKMIYGIICTRPNRLTVLRCWIPDTANFCARCQNCVFTNLWWSTGASPHSFGMPGTLHITPALSTCQGARLPTQQKSSQMSSRNLSSMFLLLLVLQTFLYCSSCDHTQIMGSLMWHM